jgi:ribosomal protein S12 methylthiotransferase
VEEHVKQERRALLMEVQEGTSHAKLIRKVGTDLEIMVDSAAGDAVLGRTRGDAPEVDGNVKLRNATGLRWECVLGRVPLMRTNMISMPSMWGTRLN